MTGHGDSSEEWEEEELQAPSTEIRPLSERGAYGGSEVSAAVTGSVSADRDAALLGRPAGAREQMLESRASWYWVSLFTGRVVSSAESWGDIGGAVCELIGVEDSVVLQKACLDAQVRRLRAWSTALQFIEEYVSALGPVDSGDRAGGGGESRDT